MRDPAAAAARGRPGADREARGGPGRRDREGQGRRRPPALGRRDEPEVDPAAAPGRRLLAALRRGRGRVRALHAQQEARDPPVAGAAAVPQPRQLRRLGRRAQPLAGREGRGGRRLHPHGDHGQQAAGRGRQGRRRAHGRQGPRQGGRAEGQLRARLGRDRQGDRARGGLLGPPDRRRAEGPRPGGQRPAGVGARRQGGLGGRAAAGEGHPHARLAAAPAGQVPGVRRLVDLRHEPRGREAEGLDRVRVRARQRRRAALGPRPAAGVQAPPARQEDPRGRQARRVGREGDPRGRLLGAPAPARTPAWSSAATPAAWSTCPS